MKKLKTIILSTATMVVVAMVAATLIESVQGSAYVAENIYHSWWFMALWAVLAITGVTFIIRMKLWKMPATLLMHIAFVIILCGALTTHIFGEQGSVSLLKGHAEHFFVLSDSRTSQLPFAITLDKFDITYYEGTASPQDYCSHLTVKDGDMITSGTASMNNIFSYDGYRFYQSGYDPDMQSTRLAVAHDPYGIAITYTGYILLLFSMLGYFFQPNSKYRKLLRNKTSIVLLMLCLAPLSVNAENTPKVIPSDLAEDFGNLYFYHNGRICPLQTFAHDFTVKLCGKDTYRGRKSEEVLAGWLFFPDTWKPEPMIKLKGSEVKQFIGAGESYASLLQFANSYGEYKLQGTIDDIVQGKDVAGKAGIMAAHEKVNIINGVFSGSSIKLFPLRQKDGSILWLSSVDNLPDGIDNYHWTIIRKQLPLIAEAITTRQYGEAKKLIAELRKYQQMECGSMLPSDTDFKAEKVYNSISSSRLWAMLCTTVGILAFIYMIWLMSKRRKSSYIYIIGVNAIVIATWVFLSVCMVLRTIISHHLPLSNGFETMQALAWLCMLISFIMQRKSMFALPFGCLVGGLAMMVAMMGESNPAVTNLMPVLQSPLLSLHVMVIMIAYALLAFMMLNSIAALILMRKATEMQEELLRLKRMSLLMLFPAVFLLTTGIFIGAVWANVSWGRYWGWDPKEVWALITMLIYALPMHSSASWLKRDKAYHTYIILAFFAVLMTYFGVNYFLPGLHSYA